MSYLVKIGLYLSGLALPVLVWAQSSTLPPVTAPYDVNATIPGEGYQGWAGPYGGEKVLQYCYFNRFLGEPKAGRTMYFEFKACDAKKTHLDGEITWGDGSTQEIKRITCGRWRIPHIYKTAGSFTANLCIDGECCKGDTATPTPAPAPAAPNSNQPAPSCQPEDKVIEPIDAVLLVDSTASMANKLDSVKAALNQLVNSLRAEDRVGIVTFANQSAGTALSLNGYNKAAALSAISAIQAQGNTSIGAGLQLGLEVLKQARPDSFKVMVVVTDGGENKTPCAKNFYASIPNDVTIFGVADSGQGSKPGTGACGGLEPVLPTIVKLGTGQGRVIEGAFQGSALAGIFTNLLKELGDKSTSCQTGNSNLTLSATPRALDLDNPQTPDELNTNSLTPSPLSAFASSAFAGFFSIAVALILIWRLRRF